MREVSPDTKAALKGKSESPLWRPSGGKTAMADFSKKMETKAGRSFPDYQSLWHWSVDEKEAFWDAVWDYCGVIGDKGGAVISDKKKMFGTKFFPKGRINYAENLLRRRDGSAAIIFRDEKGGERSLTFKELYDQVSLWQQAFIKAGVKEGDRVAAYMPNMPETIIAMLAASSLGAVWASASPDFGVQGIVDRFGQIEPKILVAVDGYYYGGKELDCLAKIKEAQRQIEGLEKTVIVPFLGKGALDTAVTQTEFLKGFKPGEVKFNRVDFNHPLFIMFSSGTTGAPKCIVHGHGGTLIQHLKEHKLHCDIHPGDKVFYFTTCGWMMWNWLASGLASGATLLLYDGSPFARGGRTLFDFLEREGVTHLGTSAKFIDALGKSELRPRTEYRFDALRTVLSTGSPLAPEGFDFVYEQIKRDVNLASISGGTDIISCFVLGNPLLPVYRGEIQCAGLGMAVDVFDEGGAPIRGAKGELVCTRPFPSMPLGFWNDEDGARYHAAYFSRFPGVWAHGDYAEITPHNGMIIHGRSDATLNPGGVRIGTAEIYRQVEQLPEILESIVIGQDWQGDTRVVLFVRMKEGIALDDALRDRIRQTIRANTTPRHVPARILAVADIPRTKSGKITELAVRDVVHGRPVKNQEALANPEALALFQNLPELQS